MMAVCCLLPIAAIFVLQAAGFSGGIVYVIAIVLCIGSHVLLMGMGGHEKHAGGGKQGEKEEKQSGGGHGSCH